ncbi:cbb3-type cytochrome c oxidase subunit 3 [Sphingomicrobium nitratireducens]|uniref:cbb3-type cytochrome c oxidase subunit 3 n=1 Tax=Sphingomicrobium nitratireducens TaxID=2964666 RepID=UPI002240B164|nr:cbb3-type cytochrome c oxidase subunit 3 [Sphingomicrobium nitratireducens]
MSYETLRHFADSWFLLAMLLLYLGFVGWAFRPGSKHANRRAATSILTEEQKDQADG